MQLALAIGYSGFEPYVVVIVVGSPAYLRGMFRAGLASRVHVPCMFRVAFDLWIVTLLIWLIVALLCTYHSDAVLLRWLLVNRSHSRVIIATACSSSFRE